MSNSFSAPMRVGAVVLGVVALIAVGLVVAYGPGEGRWLQGALSAGPAAGSASPTAAASESPAAVEEEPAGGSSPSPSTAAQIKARNIADAKASLVEYYATVAAVANDGYEQWERELRIFWGTRETRVAQGRAFEQYRQQGIRTEGVARVVSAETIEYTPADSGFEEVVLEACIDFHDVETFDADGNLVPRDASVPGRYMFTYGLRHQGVDSKWTLISEDHDQERTC